MTDLDPITGLTANPVTQRWYDLLPAVFRDADAVETSSDHPLWAYLDAVCSTLVEPTRIADRIADGQLTDPAVADDEWIPWLSQAVGVYGTGPAEQRKRIANLIHSQALGSREYLTVLVQEFLTGTRYCVVTPVAPWGIQIRVRVDELGLVGDTTAGLMAALYATGRVPSGYVLSIITDQETWAQIQVAMPTWAQGNAQMWKRVDSMGLTGAGFLGGAVRWSGTAVGDAP
jgi:hypothetical protein